MSDRNPGSPPLRYAPQYLRILADWLDAATPDEEPEVQRDLRSWADDLEEMFKVHIDYDGENWEGCEAHSEGLPCCVDEYL